MKKVIFILLLFSLFFSGFSQKRKRTNAGLGIVYLNGELSARSHFRLRKWTVLNYNETNKNTFFSGEIILNTRSYIWRPNFLLIDIGGSYSPGKLIDDYLVSPDISEVNTSKKLDLGLTLFNTKKVTLNSFVSFVERYQNRESLTNIKTKKSLFGGSVVLTNKIFPLTVTYQKTKWDQTELLSGRNYKTIKHSLQGKIIKSFGSIDRHELSYTYDDNEHEYFSAIQSNERTKIKNITNKILFNSKVFLNPNKGSNINSIVSYNNQRGNFGLKRFSANEVATLYLPKNFLSINNYEYFYIKQNTQEMSQHRLRTDLRHKLFLSLKTEVFFQYVNLKHTFYDEYNYRGGLSVSYEKKIPTKGRLELTYKYSRYHDDIKSQSHSLNIFNEEHTLSDAEFELLDKPYIDNGTVIVKDVTGTIVYQLNFDYLLIQMDNFLEIRRIPGGQIIEGGNVFVDYQAIQPGTYKYDANNHSFFANIMLFNQILEFYYRRHQQNYANTKKTDYLTLNYFTENIAGVRIRFGFGSAGIEYDDYKSTIIPFRMIKYYVQLQHNHKNKFLFSLNGNVRDYKMINNETDQTYIDISGKITYNFTRKTKLSLDVGYRNQIGQAIDLNLLTSKIELITFIRQLQFTLGAEAYKRSYINEDVDFIGAYIRIARRFNYR